jgi:hypothetical protein
MDRRHASEVFVPKTGWAAAQTKLLGLLAPLDSAWAALEGGELDARRAAPSLPASAAASGQGPSPGGSSQAAGPDATTDAPSPRDAEASDEEEKWARRSVLLAHAAKALDEALTVAESSGARSLEALQS